jgi:hypothetical protein
MPVCPQLLQLGVCLLQSCTLKHTTYLCHICVVNCNGPSQWAEHLAGRPHKEKLRGNPNRTSHCTVCVCDVGDGDRGWQAHVLGRAHRRNAGIDDSDLVTEVRTVPRDVFLCPLCQREYPVTKHASHLTSVLHRRKERFSAFKVVLSEVAEDRDGILVSHGENKGVDFGFIESASLRTQPTPTHSLTVTTNTARNVDLIVARISSTVGTHASLSLQR